MLGRRINVGFGEYRAEDIVLFFVFAWYFCYEIFLSVFVRIGFGDYFYLFHSAVFYGVLLIYGCLHYFRGFKESVICYAIITLLFAVTALMHPEYYPWFFEKTYGIQNQFFLGIGGIWAFLVVSLADDRKQLHQYLKVICWLMFVFLIFRYISAQIRGYWLIYDAEYEEMEWDYDLGFGYSMLFSVLFFAAEAFLNNRKLYYIPFALGTYMILFGGSRGAFIWVPAVFVFMLPYKWKTLGLKQRLFAILVITIVALGLLYLFFSGRIQSLFDVISKRGSDSRTITSLASGTFLDANGRDDIYRITIERIREGGMFGNGVFGERTAVGEKYRWGYAHNFFLEVFAAFGYVGGTVVSLILIYHIIQAGRYCRERKDQVIFITFAVSTLKLLLSDSFWFNRSFWGLLAIVVLWRKQDVANGLRTGLIVLRRRVKPEISLKRQ